MNFQSNNIKIYPAANRDYSSSKLNIEHNIINAINRLTDPNSENKDFNAFIINDSSFDFLSYNNNNWYIKNGFECNINGYYIKLVNDEKITLSLNNNNILILKLVTTIKTLNENQSATYNVIQIAGEDVTPTYTGVDLIIGNKEVPYKDTSGITTNYYLPIAKITNTTEGTYTKLNNRIKFNTNKTFINNIGQSDGLSNIDISSSITNKTFEDFLKNDFVLDDGEI